MPALVGDPDIEGRFFYTPDLKRLNFQHGTSPLDPFLDRLLRDQQAVRPYAMAVQSLASTQLTPDKRPPPPGAAMMVGAPHTPPDSLT